MAEWYCSSSGDFARPLQQTPAMSGYVCDCHSCGAGGGGMVCYRYLLGAGWGCCKILDNGQDSPHPTLAVEQRYQAADVHSAEA